MMEQFDAVVIGAGISGEACAHRLRRGGMRVATVEKEHIGGECAYWATIPTTSLMGPANGKWRALALAGVSSPALASPRSLTPSDILFSSLDEATQIEAIEKEGGVLIRGAARFTGHGQIAVGSRSLQTSHVVIATGSEIALPQIPGLSDSGYWSTRDATTTSAIPQSVAILGGEAQAIEIGQMFRQYGAEVTVISDQERLLIHEAPEVSALIGRHLREQGVRVVLGRRVTQIVRGEKSQEQLSIIAFDDASEALAQRLVLATGRRPRIVGLNLRRGGVEANAAGIVIDETCRAAEGVWAVGPVTGVSPLSHFAHYQARIAADDILGQPHPAHYNSVPRIYYTMPEIAAIGWTHSTETNRKPAHIRSVTLDLNERTTFLPFQTRAAKGKMTLIADASRETLIGAWAVATEASEWIQLAAFAIRAEIPLVVLRDMLEQFPPFGEVYLTAIDQLLSAAAAKSEVAQPLL